MPLNNAVMDFHALGVIDTPDGPRQRVVLVAAQRDMVERLLAAVRAAGLRPEGVDLSAFALIRSLYRSDAEGTGRVLYLNVDGLTNLAIAEGVACRFTRVVGSGLEGMASEIAERRGIAIAQARELLAAVDLTAPEQSAEEHFAPTGEPALAGTEPAGDGPVESDPGDREGDLGDRREAYEARELEMSYEELAALPEAPAPGAGGSDVRSVLERGIHDIAGEVRNSLDFHSSQHGGGHVSRVIVSGAALDIPGFVDALQVHLHVDVEAHTVGLADESLVGSVSTHRLAIAAGLATTEIAQ
jgi:type IV pilus assembly protein PilM